MTDTEKDREILTAALAKRVGGAKALEYIEKMNKGEELTYLEKRQIAESKPERPITQAEANAIAASLGVKLPESEPEP